VSSSTVKQVEYGRGEVDETVGSR